MLEAKIWDRQSPLNGVSARKILDNNPNWADENAVIFVVYDTQSPDRILRIEDLRIIRANGNYGSEISDEQVIESYISSANHPADTGISSYELAVMEALAVIYEQNLEILNR